MRTPRGNGTDVSQLVGISRALRDVVKLTDTVAQSDCCVLIEGESGTGKELLARRLHAKSRRKYGPFIPVNCSGVSASLFESQFFGHVRGAFTGAEQDMPGLIRSAQGGTIFLDEIGELPLSLQPKLLRVNEEQEVLPVGNPLPVQVDARFVAATNGHLTQMVREGKFREDLYHRLNIVRIVVSPLRDRLEDLPPLLAHFSSRFAREYEQEKIEISSEVRAALGKYFWPGNVRELAAWVERLYATQLEPEFLIEILFAESHPRAASSAGPASSAAEGLSLEEVERRAIAEAIRRCNSNQRQAAEMLQVHRATLARKLKRY